MNIYVIIQIALFLAVAFGLFRLIRYVWPKKKLCHVCKKTKTNNKNDEGLLICEECDHKQLLQNAEHEEPALLCPIHTDKVMDIRILPDFKGFIVHECPHPSCNIMVIDKRRLKDITFGELEFYPPKFDFSFVE